MFFKVLENKTHCLIYSFNQCFTFCVLEWAFRIFHVYEYNQSSWVMNKSVCSFSNFVVNNFCYRFCFPFILVYSYNNVSCQNHLLHVDLKLPDWFSCQTWDTYFRLLTWDGIESKFMPLGSKKPKFLNLCILLTHFIFLNSHCLANSNRNIKHIK